MVHLRPPRLCALQIFLETPQPPLCRQECVCKLQQENIANKKLLTQEFCRIAVLRRIVAKVSEPMNGLFNGAKERDLSLAEDYHLIEQGKDLV